MTKITLSITEAIHASMIGTTRRIAASHKKFKQKHELKKADMHMQIARDVQGAWGEAAFAKYIDHVWPEEERGIHNGDVGLFEIRTCTKNNQNLILHKEDFDDRNYVLISSEDFPTMHILGFIKGKDGKNQGYWKDNMPTPCYLVPQKDLLELELMVGKI